MLLERVGRKKSSKIYIFLNSNYVVFLAVKLVKMCFIVSRALNGRRATLCLVNIGDVSVFMKFLRLRPLQPTLKHKYTQKKNKKIF